MKSVKKNGLVSKTRLATHKAKIAAVTLSAGAIGYAAYKKYANKRALVCAGVTLDPYIKMHQELAQAIDSNTVQEQKIKNDAHAFAQKFLSESASGTLLEILKMPSLWKNKIWVSTLLKENLIRTKILELIKNNSEQVFDANNCVAIITALCQARLTKEEYNQYLHDAIIKSAPFLLTSQDDWVTPLVNSLNKKQFIEYIPLRNKYFSNKKVDIADVFFSGLGNALECLDIDTAPFLLKHLNQFLVQCDLVDEEGVQKLIKIFNPTLKKIHLFLDENKGFIEDPKVNKILFELENLLGTSRKKDKKNPPITFYYSYDDTEWQSELTCQLRRSYLYAQSTFFGLRIFEEIQRDKKTISSKIINCLSHSKELFAEYNYSTDVAIATSLYMAHQHEKELLNNNYYVFYHGQTSQLLLYEQLATLLTYDNQSDKNFLSLHVRQSQSAEKEKELREQIINPNNDQFNRRPYVLFLNASIFGNLKNQGSHSPYYLAKNFNQNPLSINLSKLFDDHGHFATWKKYADEINSLVKHSNELFKYGNFIQIAVPAGNVSKSLYLSHSGAPYQSAQIESDSIQKITSDSSEILKVYYKDPTKVKYASRYWDHKITNEGIALYRAQSDLFEFCAAMTYDEHGWLNPNSGVKMYVYSPGDQQKIAAFEHKRKELFERIELDIRASKSLQTN
ncbi:hypothetical protein Noda2021_00290 [Candidatus Dependentiae bacterium Noda2021]|nr:hypothetical protein Noda2021_00290 [Candidatus Dependentiae bacterium Noda2021]